MNEPRSPGVSLETLNKFYQLAYDAVRKHSSTVYVVLNNRIGQIDERELFPLARSFERVVLDVHYYNLFKAKFFNLTVQQNMDVVYDNRSREIDYVTTSDGPLIFIGMSKPKKWHTLHVECHKLWLLSVLNFFRYKNKLEPMEEANNTLNLSNVLILQVNGVESGLPREQQ